MMHDTHLQWPFFEARHEVVAREAAVFAQRHLADGPHPDSAAAVDAHCRSLVTHLGEAGLLSHCVPQGGGDLAALDARTSGIAKTTAEYDAEYDAANRA